MLYTTRYTIILIFPRETYKVLFLNAIGFDSCVKVQIFVRYYLSICFERKLPALSTFVLTFIGTNNQCPSYCIYALNNFASC